MDCYFNTYFIYFDIYGNYSKILAREYSEDFAMEYCYILKYLFVIFIPLNKIISKFENKVKNDHKVTATKDELVEIVKTIEGEE